MKSILATVLVPLGALAVAATPAIAMGSARTAPPVAAPAPPKGGGGQMQVNGAGNVRVTGNFIAWGDVRGMTVRVTDRYGDARVILGGERVLRPVPGAKGTTRRSVTLRPGPRQPVTIEGCRADVTFSGNGNVFISISGEGAVRLDGVGTVTVNDRATRSWPLRAATIPLRRSPPGGQG